MRHGLLIGLILEVAVLSIVWIRHARAVESRLSDLRRERDDLKLRLSQQQADKRKLLDRATQMIEQRRDIEAASGFRGDRPLVDHIRWLARRRGQGEAR